MRISNGRRKRDAKRNQFINHPAPPSISPEVLSELRTTQTHIYDWIDLPASEPGEVLAKEWFDKFTIPVIEKDNAWLNSPMLFCTYEGVPHRVTGASRLGDVWLNKDLTATHYEIRVDVTKCSDWRMENVD